MDTKDTALRFNRPGVFKPAYVRHSLESGAPVVRQSISDFDDTNALSTSSFRYDPPGVGMKSTQQLNVDYSDFASHTFFGSAEVNVNVAFEAIFNRYPFDGTRREVEAFRDGLTGFESWVLDQFPKNVGYLRFSGSTGATPGSYVTVVDHAGTQFPTISRTQSGRSKLDPGLDPMAFEFHIYVPPVANENQVVLQKLSSSVHGFTLGLIGTASTADVDLFIGFVSASTPIALSGTIRKGTFTHVVGVYDRRDDIDKLFLYADESLIASSSTRLEMGQIDFVLSPMYIGSGTTMVTSSNGGLFTPVETLSGAMDELRIFNDIRTQRQQKKYARRNIFAQPDLMLYYRFNEPSGAYGPSSTDSLNRIVLDHSGNSLFGYINESGFSYDLRVTGGVQNPMTHEEMTHNPVLFSTYQPIIEFNSLLLTSASAYDAVNPNIITRLIPNHMLLEGQAYEALEDVTGSAGDVVGGTGDGMPGAAELGQPQLLASLLYVVAKELDQVKQFIDAFGGSIFVDYDSYGTTPDQLLTFAAGYRGFDLPGLFNNATFEQFVNAQDLDDSFSTSEISLQHVQNEIWRRILSNLNEIVRSKGTVHSVKSFIRTLGIDPDQNFRIREFGGPRSGRIGESREAKSRVASALIFTGSSPKIASPPLTSSLSRTEPGFPYLRNNSTDVLLTSGSWTYEGTYIFPRGVAYAQTQSLCRIQSTTGSNGLIYLSGSRGIIANVVAISGTLGSGSVELFARPGFGSTSQSQYLHMYITGVNICDGNTWNVSFGRYRNDDPSIDEHIAEEGVSAGGSADVSSSYFLRIARSEYGEVYDRHLTQSFFMEESSTAINALQVFDSTNSLLGPKVVLGTQFVNSGSSTTFRFLNNTTIAPDPSARVTTLEARVTQLRFWSKGLTRREWLEHVRNVASIGVVDPLKNFNFVRDLSGSWGRLRMDVSIDQQVTQSDSVGSITMFDFSQNNMHMSGSGFNATSSVVVPQVFNYSMISPKFDEATTTNKIRVRSFIDSDLADRFGASVGRVYESPSWEEVEDDPRFTIDFSVVDSLNEDIVNIFATLDTLDDSLGSPTLMFSPDYPGLQALRDVYFNRLTDRVNLKGFFEFFRWFDTSIGMFIEQLIPRKTVYLGTNFVIESHMLERAKFMHQYDDVYLGENQRNPVKDSILLQQVAGSVVRY